jgi:predicted DNA-binding transcriptional regulator YafY
MPRDVDRDDWRTFRLDRMREVVATTWRFRAREHPDPVAYVQRSVTEAPYRYLARVRELVKTPVLHPGLVTGDAVKNLLPRNN